MGRLGQISVEYIALTGFLVIAIIIPSVFFLYTFVNKNVYGIAQSEITNTLGNGLIDHAREMYYLGLFSKENDLYEIPSNIEHMFILKIDDTTDDLDPFYYVGIYRTSKEGFEKNYYLSEVPLTSDRSDSSAPVFIYEHGDSYPPGGEVDRVLSEIPECFEPTHCSLILFQDNSIKKGARIFSFETFRDIIDGSTKVAITPR